MSSRNDENDLKEKDNERATERDEEEQQESTELNKRKKVSKKLFFLSGKALTLPPLSGRDTKKITFLRLP